jgi:hypothetical protein
VEHRARHAQRHPCSLIKQHALHRANRIATVRPQQLNPPHNHNTYTVHTRTQCTHTRTYGRHVDCIHSSAAASTKGSCVVRSGAVAPSGIQEARLPRRQHSAFRHDAAGDCSRSTRARDRGWVRVPNHEMALGCSGACKPETTNK